MSYEIIDADEHVTETWEQIARHLDEPYRTRPLLTPLFPQDGWDRRLLGSKGNWAYVGTERIVYASDFPHWDHSYPKSVKELADRADMADDAKRQVLAANARRFYKL